MPSSYKLPYLQDYLKTVGVRKCEANAIVPKPNLARTLVTKSIEKYLGSDALDRFDAKKARVRAEVQAYKDRHDIDETIERLINSLT